MADDRLDRALELYERAVFGGDSAALAEAEPILDAVEADLALARGRIDHARYLAERRADPHELALFEQAAERYTALGDLRGEAEALFWRGIYHQVVQGDEESGAPLFAAAYERATAAGDRLTM